MGIQGDAVSQHKLEDYYTEGQDLSQNETEDALNRMTDDEFEEYSDNDIELIDVIKRINNLPEGIFANINNDLNECIREDHPPIIQMAYAYARRTAAAGLFLQGVFSRENYLQASTIFKAFQLHTGQTVKFQEEAARQSCELLSSYDSRLEKKAITVITSMVELNKASGLYTGNGKTNIPYELVISGIQKVAGKLK